MYPSFFSLREVTFILLRRDHQPKAHLVLFLREFFTVITVFYSLYCTIVLGIVQIVSQFLHIVFFSNLLPSPSSLPLLHFILGFVVLRTKCHILLLMSILQPSENSQFMTLNFVDKMASFFLLLTCFFLLYSIAFSPSYVPICCLISFSFFGSCLQLPTLICAWKQAHIQKLGN